MSVPIWLKELLSPMFFMQTPKPHVMSAHCGAELEPDAEFLEHYFEWLKAEQWLPSACPKIRRDLESMAVRGNTLVGVALEDRRAPNHTFFLAHAFDASASNQAYASAPDEHACGGSARGVCNSHFQMLSHAPAARSATVMQTGQHFAFLDRDSVCMGDDVVAHHAYRGFDPNHSLRAFIQSLIDASYLASIQGGQATWQMDCIRDQVATPVAVVAEQWPEARLLEGMDRALVEFLGSDGALRLFCRYHAQIEPDALFQRLNATS